MAFQKLSRTNRISQLERRGLAKAVRTGWRFKTVQQMSLCVCVFSHLVVSNSGTLWTVAHQSPLFMEFPRQEYWSVLPFPTPEDLPDPGIKLGSLASPALAGGFFTTRATWEVQ